MLKRIRIKGYKSLVDVEVALQPLTVLLGPNASGKSNFLDALQILAKLGSSRTLKEAFEPPNRGKPLESFSLGESDLHGLLEQEVVSFSMEADLHLSDAVVDEVNRQVHEMRPPNGGKGRSANGGAGVPVRHRDLRYRIEIEMLPKSGVLRVADEYLAALNNRGEPTGKRQPFIERKGERIHLRREGQAHPRYHERYLDHSVLSMPHYPPHHPHAVAARFELENWLFYSFEPRERMRAPVPVKEVRRIGAMGEELPAFLNTLRDARPMQFKAVENALQMLVPATEGIELELTRHGEVEFRIHEDGVCASARVISDGTLRLLGLMSLTGIEPPPALVGFEEPENGVHPRRLPLIAEFLDCQAGLGDTQYIVTTHSASLPDYLPGDSLYVVTRKHGRTRIEHLATTWGPIWRKSVVNEVLVDPQTSDLPVSERILRGDFDA